MAFLSRSTSKESNASSLDQKSHSGSANGDLQERVADGPEPVSPPDPPISPPSLASTGRVSSHSLLTAPHNVTPPNRKSRSADVGMANGNIGRASISMPPPATKPSSIYRPSTSRRPTNALDLKDGQPALDGTSDEARTRGTVGTDDGEKGPHQLGVPVSEPQSPSAHSDSSLKPQNSSLNKPGDRLSFSSLYSLGSAVYGGAAGPNSASLSAASSTAGSVKSVEQPTPTATAMSPSLGPSKPEAASVSTTATDPISVMANSQTSHQGSRLIRSLHIQHRIMLIIWKQCQSVF